MLSIYYSNWNIELMEGYWQSVSLSLSKQSAYFLNNVPNFGNFTLKF